MRPEQDASVRNEHEHRHVADDQDMDARLAVTREIRSYERRAQTAPTSNERHHAEMIALEMAREERHGIA